jgi:hypothetical protein
MPRPSKTAEDSRSIVVTFRLRPDEAEKLTERVHRSGLDRSEFLRQAVLKTQIVIRQAPANDTRLVQELNRIGVNLNQLVQSVHTHGTVPAHLQRLLQWLEKILMQLVENRSLSDDAAEDRQSRGGERTQGGGSR